jgi:hypothetical protein
MNINTNLEGHSGSGFVPQGSDGALWVQFKIVQEKMGFLSEQEGRPIFKGFEYIEIHLPEGKSVISRRVKEEDKKRFPAQYQAFLLNKAQVPTGTPLESWPAIEESRVFELKALKIFTVEQVAEASDLTLQVMGPDARTLREKAISFLSIRARAESASAMEAENNALKARLEALERKHEASEAAPEPKPTKVKAVKAPAAPKKGRGRPKGSKKEKIVVAEPVEMEIVPVEEDTPEYDDAIEEETAE